MLCLSYLQPHPGSLHNASIIQSSVFPTSSHTLAPDTLHPPYLSGSYLQPHPCSLYIASTILSSVAPTSSHTLAPYTLRPSYNALSFLPPATPLLLIHCIHHTSVNPTSSHTLAPYTLRPPYCPQLLLHPATSWLLIHCLHHTVLSCSYLQPHPCTLYIASIIQCSVFPTSSHTLAPDTLHPPYLSESYLQPHLCSLYIASTILSSVAPSSSHILTPDTLRLSYSPLSFLPPATPLLLIHCVHHTVLSCSYLQPHADSLYIASTLLSSVSPTSSHILTLYTLRLSYSPLSFLPPATPLLLIHCVHRTMLCLSNLQPHPYSLHIASTILSSVVPTFSHTLAPDTLRPSYSTLSLLPPSTSWLLIYCVHHTILCFSYLQPHPDS